jgi:hypothetical protein
MGTPRNSIVVGGEAGGALVARRLLVDNDVVDPTGRALVLVALTAFMAWS